MLTPKMQRMVKGPLTVKKKKKKKKSQVSTLCQRLEDAVPLDHS
jgi:hypothetical protein